MRDKKNDIAMNQVKITDVRNVDFDRLMFLAKHLKKAEHKIEMERIIRSIDIKNDREFALKMILVADNIRNSKIGDLVHKSIANNGDIRYDVYIDNFEYLADMAPKMLDVLIASFFPLHKINAIKYFEKRGHIFAKRVHNYVHSEKYRKNIDPAWLYYIDLYWPKYYYNNIN